MSENDPSTAAEWVEVLAQPPSQRRYFKDEEVTDITYMSVGDLRRLQAVGLIEATKAAKPKGGFIRVWSGSCLIAAAISGEIREAFGFDISKSGEIVKNIDSATLWLIHADSVGINLNSEASPTLYMTTSVKVPEWNDNNAVVNYLAINQENDWTFNIYDRVLASVESESRRKEIPICLIGQTLTTQELETVFSSEKPAAKLTCKLNISRTIRRIYFYRWN